LSPARRVPTLRLLTHVNLLLSLIFNVAVNINYNSIGKGNDMVKTTNTPSQRCGNYWGGLRGKRSPEVGLNPHFVVGLFLSPLRGLSHLTCLPTACAVGCILSLLRSRAAAFELSFPVSPVMADLKIKIPAFWVAFLLLIIHFIFEF
jgi:hypothetical protein